MTDYTQFTAIVPADAAQTYRDAAAMVHPSAVGMFTTPLYTGAEITHYISTGMIDTAFSDVVTDPETFAVATGLSVEQGQAFKDGFSYLAVGDFEGEEQLLHNEEAIARLGLSKIPVSESE